MIVGITEFEPMDYKDKDDKWIGFDADMASEMVNYSKNNILAQANQSNQGVLSLLQ